MAAIDISNAASGGGGGGGNLQLSGGASMTSTLTAVTDTSNTSSPLKLSTTGVQIESPLRITTSDASGFYLDAEDSATNNRFSIKRDPSSQEVTLDFASNPTGSTTLVGAIRTYRDSVNLSNAMSFIEDGSIGIGTNAPIGILHLYKSAATTRMVMDGDAGQNRLISYRTGGLQRFGLYVNNTAESGSNAGSNFAIRAYSDAGTLLSTPLFITRSSGNVGIGTTAPTSKFVVSDNTAGDPTILIEKDVINSFSDVNIYSKNASTNLTTGQLAGQVSFGGYFNSNYSPSNQEFAAIQSYYKGDGTTRLGELQFRTHDGVGIQPAMTINQNQLIGIGTTAPASKLDILGGTSNGGLKVRAGNTTSQNILDIANNAGTKGWVYRAGDGVLQFYGGTFQIESQSSSDNIVLAPGASSGGVGVGVSSITARLQVKGSGSTLATTSLLVQNSAATDLLKVTDDGNIAIFSGRIFNGSNAEKSFYIDGNTNVVSNFLSVSLRVFDGTAYASGLEVVGAGAESRVGIGTTAPNASAKLQLDSTTKGFLPPRMTNAERAAIGTPAIGLMVYCTDAVEGLYVYKSTGWTFVA